MFWTYSIDSLGEKMEDEFTKMSDETLAALVAVAPNNAAHLAAAAELHRRHKQYEDKNLLFQKRIYIATILAVIIAGITLAFVVIQFCQHP
jgi:hypothetical protein